ncbi:MAG: T9SS type A sorting domain-containing protein [Candidatus Cloacimonadota bacterium]
MLRELYDREENDQALIPPAAQISANYPNPFNPSTTIEFSIPQTGQVNLCIYNIRGQRVKNLQNSVMERGYHRVVWDGRDTNNCNVASGIYFIKLESGGKTSIRKAMLLK